MTEFHWTASRKHRSRQCKECAHARQAERIVERRRTGALPTRADRLRREYGLTPEQVQVMREEQNDSCAICGLAFGERLHIDHCHETGHVRALLCHNCNLGLGHFRDDPELMQKAIRYVLDHRKRTSTLAPPAGRKLTPAERQERRRQTALQQHRSEEGRAALAQRSATYRGERGHTARLCEEDVVAIRAAYAAGGISTYQLAEKFDVSQSAISLIIKRKVWTHV
jgi:hypothetical protein